MPSALLSCFIAIAWCQKCKVDEEGIGELFGAFRLDGAGPTYHCDYLQATEDQEPPHMDKYRG